MVAIKNKQEVQTLLSSRKSGGVKKPILFITEINSLKKGEGLFIPTKDWKLQTKPSSYYYSKVTKSEETKSIKVSKVEGGYLITKLQLIDYIK